MALPGGLELLVSRLARVLVPAAVFVATTLVFYLVVRFLLVPNARRAMDALAVDPAVELPVLKVLDATVAVVAILVGASVSGLARFLAATAAITAGLTIALGFAARDVLGNLVSGVFIVLDPTFDIGDWIRWGDREGVIEDISFRTTRVHTFDNEVVSVPNSELATNAVENPAAKDYLRLSVPFELDVENEFDLLIEIFLATARDHPEILDRPAASARVREIVGTSVVVDVRFWVAHPDQADVIRVRSEYIRAAKGHLETHDIDYPADDISGEIGVRRAEQTHPATD